MNQLDATMIYWSINHCCI